LSATVNKPGAIHGENACFLPLKQLDQDYYAPRIIQVRQSCFRSMIGSILVQNIPHFLQIKQNLPSNLIRIFRLLEPILV